MKHLSVIIASLALCGLALAGPGAHGPNGEHLDGAVASADAGHAPMLETFTESFELVAQLGANELSVLVDRYETNEPVLNGQLEVQYKNIKAKATFHPDIGSYALTDPRLLKALSAPGKHALLFTLVAGDDSDLLEGTLAVEEDHHEHAASRNWSTWAGAAIAATLAILIAFVVVRRRKGAHQ
jgi:hypothetical protein